VKRTKLRAIVLACIIIFLSGCAKSEQKVETQIFAMDTLMTLSVTGSHAQEACGAVQALIVELDGLWSVTNESSDLWRLNHARGEWVSISRQTLSLWEEASALSSRTEGALNPAIYPVVRAWGFTTGEYRVPQERELAALLEHIDISYVQADTQNTALRIPADMQLDFGAVAKGRAGGLAAELLREMGITSACLNLGGNVQTVGSRPDGTPWRVGLRDPLGEEGDYLAILSVEDQAVVTSGGYQRYFDLDGERYWHILDPESGYPARSGLLSVTVVGPSGTVCDGLSTALFVMGEEQAVEFWRGRADLIRNGEDFDLILVREDGSVVITEGLESRFVLTTGYEDTRVEVVTW